MDRDGGSEDLLALDRARLALVGHDAGVLQDDRGVANVAWSSVVPWKSNAGFLTALLPRVCLSASRCAASCSPATCANFA
jgi:hypothetical protein